MSVLHLSLNRGSSMAASIYQRTSMTCLQRYFRHFPVSRRRYGRKCALKAAVIVIVFVICIVVFQTPESFVCQETLPSWVRESDYLPFEPELYTDFPTVVADTPRIPHIIHQTYKNELIPVDYHDYIKTFSNLNPEWEYYFWTDESARRLIEDRHPHLLAIWDNYVNPINRADALRYVVLYEFGGVYADLDYECLRPLDTVTFKYTCIFPTEPFEQTALFYNTPFLLTNALMMCRPKHPFIKQLLDSLPSYHPMVHMLDIAGPSYVTHHFLKYNKFNNSDFYRVQQTKESNAPYIYTGSLLEEDVDAVYVPNSQYFTNSLATHGFRKFKQCLRCRDFANLGHYQKRGCVDLLRRKRRKNTKYAFTDHHWMQRYHLLSAIWIRKTLFWSDLDIRMLVPRLKQYTDLK